MRTLITHVFFAFAAMSLALEGGNAVRGEDEPATKLLPAEAGAWINAPPLTPEMLEGKGVVLWFFEEQCPSCRGKWPGMYELAKKYESEPVVFIAVNSGNPRGAVEQYARGVNLKWPVIVDPSREFEQQFLGQEISLQNIYQAHIILPDGKKQQGNWSDLDETVKRALEGAKWKIDPATIPAAFQPTWRLVELGQYSAAAPMLKKGLVTTNSEVKAAAQRVNAFVQEQITAAVEKASEQKKAGDSWKAYQAYKAVATGFAGHDLPAEVTLSGRELASSETVKNEMEAAKMLEAIKRSFPAATNDTAKKRILTRLEALVKKHAGTEAAAEAQQFLDQAAGM